MFGVLVQKLALVDEDVHVQGAYINLLANCLDNFTHGLAIGGSFMIDSTTGLTTTASILIHEVNTHIGFQNGALHSVSDCSTLSVMILA